MLLPHKRVLTNIFWIIPLATPSCEVRSGDGEGDVECKKSDAMGHRMCCFKSITVSLNGLAARSKLKTQGKRGDLLTV
jgi:hypothetical protein